MKGYNNTIVERCQFCNINLLRGGLQYHACRQREDYFEKLKGFCLFENTKMPNWTEIDAAKYAEWISVDESKRSEDNKNG